MRGDLIGQLANTVVEAKESNGWPSVRRDRETSSIFQNKSEGLNQVSFSLMLKSRVTG